MKKRSWLHGIADQLTLRQINVWFLLGFIFFQLYGCSAVAPNTSGLTEKLIKSEYDSRSYRSLVLKNRLQVLLISDPETDQAAAAMDVAVGQFNDPPDRQGLAHFLEHMLFLGTDKYPDADEYGGYLSAHGGSSNAFTGLEDTNYFFSIHKDYLEGALDRFSQFFIAPRFDDTFVEREINAVNSEHQKNIKNDDRRIYQILRNTANPKHPFHMFGTGNLASLRGENPNDGELREQLIRFYRNHYSANLMKLVILGKEPLADLEKLAITYFSNVPNTNIKPDSFADRPVIEPPLGRRINIRPVKSVRQLKLMFPIPDQRSNYPFKTSTLITQLLGDEGKGSILALLKEQGLAVSLSAGVGPESRDFAFIDISISLTPEGLRETEKIIEIVFQYINQIKRESNLERYFQESRKIAAIDFRFREKEEPSDYVSRLAMNLQNVPLQHVLVSPWLYQEYSKERQQALLKYLTPENMQIILVAEDVPADSTDPWYGTRYSVERIPENQLLRWNSAVPQPALALPPPNPFIIDTVSFRPNQSPERYPVLLKNTDRIRIWFKQDNVFKVPRGNFRIRLSTPDAYSSAKNAAMTKLFTLLLQERLNEYSYPAVIAGLHYSITNSVKGIELSLSGYSDNLPILFRKVIEEIKGYKIDEDRFSILRNQLAEDRRNMKLSEAFQQTGYEMVYLLSTPFWHTDEYLAVIDDITVQDLAAFLPTLFSRLHIDFLAHGNFNERDVLEQAAFLEDRLGGSGPVELPLERTMILPTAKSLVYQFKVEDVNSAIDVYYQVGPETVKQSVSLDMIQQMIEKPFYNQLRTIEQLGYIVWSGHRESGKVDGFVFIIQSSVKDPVYLQSRIEQFIFDFNRQLDAFPEKEFAQFKEALIAQRREMPKSLQEETHRYWQTISSARYDFDYRDVEIEELKKLNLADVKTLFKKIFVTAVTVRQIAVQAVGRSHQQQHPQGEVIVDPGEFKREMKFYPNPEGKINMKPVKISLR
ncbi:insulinase family protein [bacterium]|nr:insulinase family protein [bacterium]